MIAASGQSTTDCDNSVKCKEVINTEGEKMECNREVNVSDEKSNLSIFKIEDNFGLTVFVGNLTNNVTTKLLKDFFVHEGSLQTNDISRIGQIWKFVKDNKTCGVTFVEFSSDTSFQIALTLNSKVLNGDSIIIVPAVLSHQGLMSLYASCHSTNSTDTAIQEENEVMDIGTDEINSSEVKHIPSNDKEEENKNKSDVKTEIVIDIELEDENKHITGNILGNVSNSIGNVNNDILENDEKAINSTNDFKETVAVTNINNNFQSVNEKKDNTSSPSPCDKVTRIEDNVKTEEIIVDEIEGNDCKINEEISPTPTKLNNFGAKQDEATSKSQLHTKQNKFVAIVKNLPPNTKEVDLLKFFNITRESVFETYFLKNTRRRSDHTMRATVSFTSEECLKQCLFQTKSLFNGRQIFVEKYNKTFGTNVGGKRQNKMNMASPDPTLMSPAKVQCKTSKFRIDSKDKIELDLFIKHLPRDVSDRQLIDFFSSAGAVITKIYRFPDLSKDRGMAFVTMEDTDSVIKGLAMNCKIISGFKIRVYIRNDRKHLVQPIKDENIPNFSTFIGNLPIKESADALKLSLKKFFEMSGCSINFINVPQALNHSGNRAYAFIIFEDEESLVKCQKFHKTEILLSNCKAVVDISKQWPEIILGQSTVPREKARDVTYSQDDLLRGRQNKRRRKGTTPPRTSWNYKSKDSHKSLFPNPLYQSNHCDYPPDQHSSLPDNSSYNSDYKKYHDYLDMNDYVSARNTYDNSTFLSLEPQTSNLHEDFRSQSIEPQVYPNAPQHAQGSSLSVHNPELENGVRETSSYASRGYRDRMNYGDLELPMSSGSYKWRDSPEYRMSSHRGGTTDPDRIPASSSLRMGASSVLSGSDNQVYETSSYKLRNPFYTEREIVPPFSKPYSSQEGSERRNLHGSLTSDYFHPMRKVDYGSSVTIPAGSNLRSISSVASSSVQSDALFTRLDRRQVPYSGSEFSGYSGSNDRAQKSSYSSTQSTNRYSGEITYYGHHLLQNDEKRKQPTYDKQSSFVTKLASSGILSNAGYNSYPGVGSYHAN